MMHFEEKSGISMELLNGQFVIELVWVAFSEREILNNTSEKHLSTFL